MGWRGLLRTMAAESRRYERAQHRRQRELNRGMAIQAKLEERAQAAAEVECYENLVACLRSVHQEVAQAWEWNDLASRAEPSVPTPSNSRFKAARAALESFRPSLFDRILSRGEKRRSALRVAMEEAVEADSAAYAVALENHTLAVKEWQETRDLAIRVLALDPAAMEQAIEAVQPLNELSDLGSHLTYTIVSDARAVIEFHVNGADVIPSECKTLLKTGKVSAKKMPVGQFHDLYQDFVCGAVFRIARESFAFLPLQLLSVTAVAEILDTTTGHLTEQPIVSVLIPRQTVEKLNFDTLDPSDALINFVHNMEFRKTKGFCPIERVGLPEAPLHEHESHES